MLEYEWNPLKIRRLSCFHLGLNMYIWKNCILIVIVIHRSHIFVHISPFSILSSVIFQWMSSTCAFVAHFISLFALAFNISSICYSNHKWNSDSKTMNTVKSSTFMIHMYYYYFTFCISNTLYFRALDSLIHIQILFKVIIIIIPPRSSYLVKWIH